MFTINSKTSLPQDDKNIRSNLVNYLQGQCSLSELQENLKQYVIFDFDVAKKERRIQNISSGKH